MAEERADLAKDGNSISLNSVDERRLMHQGTIQRVGDSELKMTGKIIMGSRTDPYEVRLVRRKAKK